MEYKQDAQKCVILLHEIYGINQHITNYAENFFQEGFDVYLPDLLGRPEPFPYEEEEQAYENFMVNVGFLKAAKQVEQLIQKISPQYEEVRIVGFSVGATVAWLCSAKPSVQKVIGFYGSRIREYVDIVPTADVFLIYGAQEKSFHPEELKAQLAKHPRVAVEIVEGAHGFADPYSAHYDAGVTKSLIGSLVE